MFAPTDEAFAKLPAATLNDLLKPENKAKLQRILTYHVVADPDAFLKSYVNRIGQVLNDPPAIQVLRSH